MPLSSGTSKASRQGNIAKEIEAGKPPKQAVAIAYAQQRKNIARKADDQLIEISNVLGELQTLISQR